MLYSLHAHGPCINNAQKINFHAQVAHSSLHGERHTHSHLRILHRPREPRTPLHVHSYLPSRFSSFHLSQALFTVMDGPVSRRLPVGKEKRMYVCVWEWNIVKQSESETTQNSLLSPPAFTHITYYITHTYSNIHTHTSHLGVTKFKCQSTSAAGVHISFLDRYVAYGALIPGSSFFASRWQTGGPAKTHIARQICPCKLVIYHTIGKYTPKTACFFHWWSIFSNCCRVFSHLKQYGILKHSPPVSQTWLKLVCWAVSTENLLWHVLKYVSVIVLCQVAHLNVFF